MFRTMSGVERRQKGKTEGKQRGRELQGVSGVAGS